METVNKIFGIIQGIFAAFDGHKTEYGVKLAGIILIVMNFENTFNIHPEFLNGPLEFLGNVAGWLAGAGVAHKAMKTLSPGEKVASIDKT